MDLKVPEKEKFVYKFRKTKIIIKRMKTLFMISPVILEERDKSKDSQKLNYTHLILLI